LFIVLNVIIAEGIAFYALQRVTAKSIGFQSINVTVFLLTFEFVNKRSCTSNTYDSSDY